MLISRLRTRTSLGQALPEYMVTLLLIFLVTIGALTFFGGTIRDFIFSFGVQIKGLMP